MTKQQLHKEFDEKWKDWLRSYGVSAEYYKFLQEDIDSKIQEILQELVGEEKDTVLKIDMGRYNLDRIHGAVGHKLRDAGYNKKRQEILDKIKELGYE